jgi:tRNA 2-thiouridine synthesizing protein A
MSEPVEIDTRGHRCPVPTLKLRRAVSQTAHAGIIRLLADDPMAQIDIPHFCAQNRHKLMTCTQIDDHWVFEIAFVTVHSV